VSISVDASITASADGESPTENATGAEQAKSDADGTDTTYSTDETSGDGGKGAGSHNEDLLSVLEKLSTTMAEVIELLGGCTADTTQQPVSSDAPAGSGLADASANNELSTEKLVGLAEKLDQIIGELSGGETSDVTHRELLDPSDPEPGGQLITAFSNMDSEGQNKLIKLLASGECGDAGVKIAEPLPKAIPQSPADHDPGLPEANEIKELMSDEKVAKEILTAALPILEEHTPVFHGDPTEPVQGPD
jgi:hypothetical protein